MAEYLTLPLNCSVNALFSPQVPFAMVWLLDHPMDQFKVQAFCLPLAATLLE
ncbi:hypothetical protein D9M71_748770 [compost metagenome]